MDNNNNNNNNSEAYTSCTVYCYKLKSVQNTSPAYLNSQRACILNDSTSLVASGNRLFRIDVQFPKQVVKNFTKIKGIPTPIILEDGAIKETSIDIATNTHIKREIQSVVSNNDYSRVGVIDSHGAAAILDSEFKTLYSLPPVPSAVDSGWSGISFDPKDSSLVATTRHFERQLHLYKGDQLLTSFPLQNNPTQVLHVRESLIAVTENNQLNIYDIRTNKPAHLQKFALTPEPLYTLSASVDGVNVGVGGAARSFAVYDSRKWTNIGTWASCLKYEVSYSHFSEKHSDVVYLSGLDSEILAGEWDGSGVANHFSGLRVDSRWVGVSKLKGQESLFGMTSSGNIYYVHDADRLYTPPPVTLKHNLKPQHNKEKKKPKKDQQQPQQAQQAPPQQQQQDHDMDAQL
ncbi:hypothetical protein SAMD00019534_012350 [Acytostelium subglobosum LB1]|uniref:hypothetical protein n=1 Tax=Acytostelium subglobosum LB1 TaxID=1410327 RepID=UPI000644AA31|nr:hypothetical protein SAMD00019534_012350 [Acytostelium subglobosum LB1]GAM18060.1 hypothetical protein SAMD00019534_012350 [Acytostelium subglobosum LB1]|eukprot:XP_012758656.1 hypothetical protein SAMD00019534_012350 [Acytostelium subglobosum LB1]